MCYNMFMKSPNNTYCYNYNFMLKLTLVWILVSAYWDGAFCANTIFQSHMTINKWCTVYVAQITVTITDFKLSFHANIKILLCSGMKILWKIKGENKRHPVVMQVAWALH